MVSRWKSSGDMKLTELQCQKDKKPEMKREYPCIEKKIRGIKAGFGKIIQGCYLLHQMPQNLYRYKI